jgi:hypothetical protein
MPEYINDVTSDVTRTSKTPATKDSGEIIVKYCPTRMMIADILTKPLEGALFRELKTKVLHGPELKGRVIGFGLRTDFLPDRHQ